MREHLHRRQGHFRQSAGARAESCPQKWARLLKGEHMPSEDEIQQARSIELKPPVDLWMHQNTLMWSRIQLLSLFQGGALVANSAVGYGAASLCILVVAGAGTIYLNFIWSCDRETRNTYAARLAMLGFKVAPTPDERASMRVPLLFYFRVTGNTHAGQSLAVIFWTMLVIDVVVLVVSWWRFPVLPL